MSTTSAGAHALASLRGYRVDRFLQRGPSGLLYLAHSEALPGRVALKVLSAELSATARFRARFVDDVRIAGAIGHPGIIPIHEVDTADGRLFVAMRLVEGSDLGGMLRAGPLSVEQTLQVIEQTAGALHAAHSSGIVHRDLKPSNILLEARTHRVYVTDFALRPTVREYCAPELLAGTRTDGRADVYSLGVVLVHCVTGSSKVDTAPDWLREVAETATAEDPAGRYSTTVELVQAFREALDARPAEPEPVPVVAEPEPEPAPAAAAAVAAEVEPAQAEAYEFDEPEAPRRSRKRLLIAALLVAMAAVAGILLVTRGGSTHNPAAPAPPHPAPLLPRVQARVNGIVPLQQALTDRVRGADGTPASTRGIEAAAASLADRLGKDEGWVSTVHPRTKPDRAVVSALTAALVAQAAYAASLANLAPATTISKQQAEGVVTKARRAEQAYARLASAAPALPSMPLNADDNLKLLPGQSSALYDRVANTGGVGVRYRTSPQYWCGSAPPSDPCWKSVVPGAGASEGARLRIYCYVRGASVHGDTWWAKVAVGPDEYVPATFLAAGHSGRPIAATSC